MKKNNFDSSTALRILDAAEKEFSEKGYDGSRVDEIARRANINKSQLYYYFGSKENIFSELMKRNIKEAEDIVIKSFDLSKVSNKESFLEFVDELYSFFKHKESILKIAMTEMVKSNSSDFTIFEMFEPLYRKIHSSTEKMGFEVENTKSPAAYFFLDIVPILAFAAYSSKFSAFYKIPQEELEKEFSSVYKKNQLKYFENLYAKFNKINPEDNK